MNFIIDHREKDLKTIFTEATFENLDLGDIHFKYQDQTFLLIERKKMTDLIASVNDGRYRNQKKRLLQSPVPNDRILYLLEGTLDDVPGQMKTVFGMMINTLYRDKIPVLFLSSFEETIYFLKRIKEKLESNDQGLLKDFLKNDNTNNNDTPDHNQEYLNTIKMKRKDNLTPLNCSILQLAQIPGLSVSTATIILKEYQSLSKLILSYQDKEEKEKELMLANLEISTSTGKTRKLGPTLSKRVYQYLTNQESSSSSS